MRKRPQRTNRNKSFLVISGELLGLMETEEDYYRLLGKFESYEEDSNFPMLYASAIPVTSAESVLSSFVWNSTLNYNCAVTKNNNQNFYLFKNILSSSNYIIKEL